ncbi:MAG: hypothetical protein ACRC2J_03285 [Microcoleaceae cyanobacterium]|jgi:hypothetical protein
MAKRRNLKKEKAQRNLAYARKFRKRKAPNYFNNRRPGMGMQADTSQAAEGDYVTATEQD